MDRTKMREEVEAILRRRIKVDATGLAPAVIGHHVLGFDEAADALLPLLTAAHARGFREGIEAAAKVAEQHAHDAVTIDTLIAGSIASAIRALPPPGQGEA